MIQAAINRDEKPNLKAIEEKINEHSENYYLQIEAHSATLGKASIVLNSLISDEEIQKLKETFRLLCKKLYLDLNPGQPEEDKDLFIKVKATYDLQKIEELQKILLYVDVFNNKVDNVICHDGKKDRIEHPKKNSAIFCDNIRIGFVSVGMNLICSRLMNVGKLFFCHAVSKS